MIEDDIYFNMVYLSSKDYTVEQVYKLGHEDVIIDEFLQVRENSPTGLYIFKNLKNQELEKKGLIV